MADAKTWLEAVDIVHEHLTAEPIVVGTARAVVLDHEPMPGGIPRPFGVTVSASSLNEDFYGVAVKVYADASVDVRAGQRLLLAATPLVDAMLPSTADRPAWSLSVIDELAVLCMTSEVRMPRPMSYEL